MAQRCGTCIYRPDGLKLRAGYLAEFTQDNAAGEGHVICHETWMNVPDGTPGAVCRGYLDATGDRSLAIRVARALGCLVEIQPQPRNR
jgi:hypothetical protein